MALTDHTSSPYAKWMEGSGPYSHIVISSRVRLARNLAAFPFPHVLGGEAARRVWEEVRSAAGRAEVREKLGPLDFVLLEELPPLERQILVEKHLTSPQHVEEAGPGRGLVLSQDGAVSIMVNEEDHLRLQVFWPALQLEAAWELAAQVDDLLEERLDYAFDEQYGYLTACPTNTGTGLRASVMVHLPALTITQQASRVFTNLSKLGLVVRGLFGEGTEAKGNLFQISNQVTLGPNEEEIISNLTAVTKQVIEQEQLGRENLRQKAKAQLEDMVFRSYGILKNAYILSTDEAMVHLSNVRLGVDMGLIRDVDTRTLNELLVRIRPAFLQKAAGKEMDAFARDLVRASVIREILSGS